MNIRDHPKSPIKVKRAELATPRQPLHGDHNIPSDEEEIVNENITGELELTDNSPKILKQSEHTATQRVPTEDTESKVQYGLIFASIIVLFIGVYLCFPEKAVPLSKNGLYDFDELKRQINVIRQDFPSQGDIWTDFFSGIKRVSTTDPTEPSVFVLVNDGDDSTSSCLARKIAQVAQRWLNTPRQDSLQLDANSIKEEELSGGNFTIKYQPLVESRGHLIVTNLHAMPSSVARSLHSFCDSVTPIVRRAIIVFTLRGAPEGLAVKAAWAALNAAWPALDADTRLALITRVTSGEVIRIVREPVLKC